MNETPTEPKTPWRRHDMESDTIVNKNGQTVAIVGGVSLSSDENTDNLHRIIRAVNSAPTPPPEAAGETAKQYATEIHDSEIFLLYGGLQAGVLFPQAGFEVGKIREAVAILNQPKQLFWLWENRTGIHLSHDNIGKPFAFPVWLTPIPEYPKAVPVSPDISALTSKLAEMSKEREGLLSALDIGQRNCDDVYNDLKKERDIAKSKAVIAGRALIAKTLEADGLRKYQKSLAQELAVTAGFIMGGLEGMKTQVPIHLVKYCKEGQRKGQRLSRIAQQLAGHVAALSTAGEAGKATT